MERERAFYRRAEEWLNWLLEVNPVAATQLGDHRRDDRLADYTAEALESQHQEMLTALAEFQAMDTASFRLDACIDHTLIVQLLKSFIRLYERVQGHRRNPGDYLQEILSGVVVLIMKEFAPLPERLRSILGRVRETPRVLDEGLKNIAPVEAPRLWGEILEAGREFSIRHLDTAPPTFSIKHGRKWRAASWSPYRKLSRSLYIQPWMFTYTRGRNRSRNVRSAMHVGSSDTPSS